MSIFLSLNWIGSSMLSDYNVPIEFGTFYRMMIASLILYIYLKFKKQKLSLKLDELIVVLATSTGTLSVLFIAYGTKYITSGLAACVSLSQIFVTEIFDAIYERRMVKIRIILSGIIGFIGVFMLCNQQIRSAESVELKMLFLGIFFSFLSAVSPAIDNIVFEKSQRIVNKIYRPTFLFYNCLFAGLFTLIIGVILHSPKEIINPAIFDVKYITLLSYLAITVSIFSMLSMYYIVEKQGAVKLAYINFIMPIFTMIISTVVEGYRWSLTSIIGMIILIFSIYIGAKREKK